MFGVRCHRDRRLENLSCRVRTRIEKTPGSSLNIAEGKDALDSIRRCIRAKEIDWWMTVASKTMRTTIRSDRSLRWRSGRHRTLALVQMPVNTMRASHDQRL